MSELLSTVSFAFESAVLAQDGKSIIQLATDSLSTEPVSFDIQIHYPYYFYKCLNYCLAQIIKISYPYVAEKYDYFLWKKEKIIQNLAETLNEDKNKPDHMRQDLKVLEERRDNLTGRIRRQLTQYDDNKDKLLDTIKLHQMSFKQFLPFICSNYPDLFIIEVINEYRDYYVRYELSRRSLSYSELPKLGSALVEFNYQFFEEFNSKINIVEYDETSPVLLTSNKMSSKDLINRSSTVLSKRRVKFTEKQNDLLYISSITDHIFSVSESQFINTHVFTKPQFFDFIQKILQHDKRKEEIEIMLRFSSSVKANYWETLDDKLVYYIPNKSNRSSRFKVKLQPFLELRSIVQLVDEAKFLYIDTHFPVMVILNVGLDKLILIMNFVDKKYELKLFNSLLLSKIVEFGENSLFELEKFFVNNRTGDNEEIEFTLGLDTRVIDAMLTKLASFGLIIRDKFNNKIRYRNPLSRDTKTLLNSAISEDHSTIELAARISNLIQAYLQVELGDESSVYYITGFSFHPVLTFDRNNEIISMNCDCRNFTNKNPCYHIFALHTAVIRGGYYE